MTPFFVLPYTSVPDYVGADFSDPHLHLAPRPQKKQKDNGRLITHPTAEIVLKAAKQAAKKNLADTSEEAPSRADLLPSMFMSVFIQVNRFAVLDNPCLESLRLAPFCAACQVIKM